MCAALILLATPHRDVAPLCQTSDVDLSFPVVFEKHHYSATGLRPSGRRKLPVLAHSTTCQTGQQADPPHGLLGMVGARFLSLLPGERALLACFIESARLQPHFQQASTLQQPPNLVIWKTRTELCVMRLELSRKHPVSPSQCTGSRRHARDAAREHVQQLQ